MAQNQNDHIHAWVLDLPPTALQKRLALGLVVATAVAFVAVLPVSDHPLVEMNALFRRSTR